jgi:large conductance mechanosensitive channel
MIQGFKDFIMRGNVLDLAVAVVIGNAFGVIVTSLVDDLLMPLVGLVSGGIDFSDRFVDLSGEGYSTLSAAQAAGAATLNYGLFINHITHFLIVAAAIYFMVVRPVSQLQKSTEVEEEQAAEPTAEELLVEIRDLLAAQKR